MTSLHHLYHKLLEMILSKSSTRKKQYLYQNGTLTKDEFAELLIVIPLKLIQNKPEKIILQSFIPSKIKVLRCTCAPRSKTFERIGIFCSMTPVTASTAYLYAFNSYFVYTPSTSTTTSSSSSSTAAPV
jgi:hypothetical protein